jgi:ribosomal protein L22
MATEKKQAKQEEKKKTIEKEEPKIEQKAEAEKKPAEKKEEKQKVKKEEAIARGLNLHASLKHLMAISRFIKGKTIDSAIADLEDVLKMKKVVPFSGEIPHRKGMMSGRYPINASKQIITVLKGLKGNAIVNGIEPEKTIITFASANWDSRPAKKGGARFKRSNILLKAREASK